MDLTTLIQLCTTVGTVAGAFYAGWNRVGTKKLPLNELLARLEGKVDNVVDAVNGLHGKVAKVELKLEALPTLEQRIDDAENRVSYLENGGFR